MKTSTTQMTAAEFRAQLAHQESEHSLQKRCVTWFRQTYPQLMLQATPNAALRTKAERGRAIDEGMISGWPDLQLAYPSHGKPGLFIEMKTAKGTPSDAQITVQAYLRAVGYDVAMPRSFDEFQKCVNEYLNL